MITIAGEATKIHLATGATDLRRGYVGLYTLIEHQLGEEPKAAICGYSPIGPAI